MPVFHFGMTGMLQVKGQPCLHYGKSEVWPPRFMKFVLYLRDGDDHDGSNPAITQLAFSDARRLGRIRLSTSPLTEPPIVDLGFDPILSMPSLSVFNALVQKRTCPIKALLLDQSFSAGVGNYLADEILYHARVHPEQRCRSLSDDQTAALHHQIADVCRIAVEANADDSKYPAHWLFKHRWGKGKKAEHTMKLPSGAPATIRWITVGGRTSAYVSELQQLSSAKTQKLDAKEDDSDLTPLSSEAESSGDKVHNHEVILKPSPRKRKRLRGEPPSTGDGVKLRRSKRTKT
ncbi:hypothetical protein SERLADRAFT_458886 [Serpula lacrymans var. lacrymans S7.9]|nr:uncharacterized protein SERLADRAFT_458886 [Serpula lacrymans var. lacrymans S7.9]EGO28464.1 hypothetical protein SERLADRAFT_458886 [Serpula lacrymans var. lacrymans S7.9]